MPVVELTNKPDEPRWGISFLLGVCAFGIAQEHDLHGWKSLLVMIFCGFWAMAIEIVSSHVRNERTRRIDRARQVDAH